MTRATKSDLAVLQRLYDAQRRLEAQPENAEAVKQAGKAMSEAGEWLRRHWRPGGK